MVKGKQRQPDDSPSIPRNVDAEKSVLGAIMLNNALLSIAAERLKPSDFFFQAHHHIFSAMIEMGQRNTPIDLVTLSEELHRAGDLELSGGDAYLAQLSDGVPKIKNVEHYCDTVKDKARLRHLIHTADEIQKTALDEEDDVDVIIDQAEISLAAIKRQKERARDIFDTREEFESALAATFSITGFLQDYCVNAIAGLSENGKTWISLNIAAALLFGPGRLWDFFEVTERAEKIIYLIPEASRSTFKSRLKLTGLYDEIGKRLFVRTLTKGPALALGDPAILREAKGAHVFCDTAIRFMKADENSAIEAAQGLSDDFFALQRAEAKSVISLFHSPKSFVNQDVMGLENMIRGSSEFGAAIASAWGIRQIDKDQNIIHVSKIKARDYARCRDFQLIGRPYIDDRGEFAMHRRPGECGPLSEHVERGSRGGASEETRLARANNVSLLREWLREDPNQTSKQLSARFKASGIDVSEVTVRKYKMEIGK